MFWRKGIPLEKIDECLRYSRIREDLIEAYHTILWRYPDWSIMQQMFWRKAIDLGTITKTLQFQGIAPEFIDKYESIIWKIPDPSSIIDATIKRIIGAARMEELLAYHGLRTEDMAMLLESAWKFPGFAEAREMRWRGFIDDTMFELCLLREGTHPDFIPAYKALLDRIPSISDIITMMVREVFIPERFAELVLEYPPEATEYGALWGFSESWMRRLWAMHWILVPIGQLYDMYHRGIIDYATLERFVRYHDIEPMCRPWVIELAWELPGRIDLRWMFEWAVMRSYGEITGRTVEEFEPLPEATDAEIAMTEWLIADGIHPKIAPYVARAWVRNLLREEIMGAFRALMALYREGFRDLEDLYAFCKEHGIPDRRAEYYLMRAEWEREREEKADLVKAVVAAFRKEKIDETKARQMLYDIGVKTWRIDAIMAYEIARKKIEKEVA